MLVAEQRDVEMTTYEPHLRRGDEVGERSLGRLGIERLASQDSSVRRLLRQDFVALLRHRTSLNGKSRTCVRVRQRADASPARSRLTVPLRCSDGFDNASTGANLAELLVYLCCNFLSQRSGRRPRRRAL